MNYNPLLLCPWDFPGKNTGVGCHSLLQGIVLTRELSLSLLHLLHWQADSSPLILIPLVLVLLSLVLILLSPTPWMAGSPYVRIIWTLLCLQMSRVGVWLILVSDWWVEAFRAAVWFGLNSFVTRFLCPRHGAFLSARIWTNKARKTIADLQLKWMMSKKSLLLWAVVTYKCFFTREKIN